ncbi:hypothetical protein WR25_18064 [Diploscapter pachys]|uniref:guanylate cyclase n=1 Tax=Diploscapter pachys TaxID=2018661 RepID=A0A2A2JEE7_9BILA|nr:hypothetical protein WR25_18064 [Diploscapter pachys]
MFGFIHESIRQWCYQKYGEDAWIAILKRSGFESGKENIVNHYYSDQDTYILVDAVSTVCKMTREEVWENYGAFVITYIMEAGWDELVRSMSPNLKGLLDNLDSLHYFIDHVVYKANLRGPSFRCEDNPDGTITLHYYTGRPGLYPIVKGILREAAKKVFKLDIAIDIIGRTQRSVQMSTGERIEEHVIFQIKAQNTNQSNEDALGALPKQIESSDYQLRLSNKDFVNTFPYHIVFDRDCKLIQVGREIYSLSESDFATNPNQFTQSQHLKLKGQMMIMSGGNIIMYLCSPDVTSIPELLQFGMRMNSMPLHDATRDLILLNQQRLSDVEMKEEGSVKHFSRRKSFSLQLESNNEQLEQMAKDLEVEKGKTDALLREMLPPTVAQQLKNGLSVDAREYEEATIMFSDVPTFQQIVPLCQPKDIVHLLNELFTKFDRLIGLQKAYKVETVGDSYMSVGGIPDAVEDHCEIICHLALGMLMEARSVCDPISNNPLSVRCGIHSGPVVAGVVGTKMPRYCLFGDTVNTASRMESYSPPGRIHCSETAKLCAEKTGRVEFEPRGKVQIKGKGEMNTYFLIRSFKLSIWEITSRARGLIWSLDEKRFKVYFPDEDVNSIDGYQELRNSIVDDIIAQKATKGSRNCVIV